jgi:hypothetical protein
MYGRDVCTVVDNCWRPPSKAMLDPNFTLMLRVPGVEATLETAAIKVTRTTVPMFAKKLAGIVNLAAAGSTDVSVVVLEGPA